MIPINHRPPVNDPLPLPALDLELLPCRLSSRRLDTLPLLALTIKWLPSLLHSCRVGAHRAKDFTAVVSDDGLATDGEAASLHGWSDGDDACAGENAVSILEKHSLGQRGRRAVSCSPTKRGILPGKNRPPVSWSLSPSRNPEDLISPSVLVSRSSSLPRRNNVDKGKSTASVTAVASRGGASRLPEDHESLTLPRESSGSVVPGRSYPATLTPSGSSGGGGSDASSDSDDYAPAPSPSSARSQLRLTNAQHKKQPLLLPRGHFRQQHQRQQRIRPVPHGLATAAATAAARAAQRDGTTVTAAGASDAGDAAPEPHRSASKAGAIAAAPLGSDRAVGASALHDALQGLRVERDSLASACKRLEAEREAAARQLSDGTKRAMELHLSRETLETERDVLAARCAELEAQQEACAERECAREIAAEEHAAAALEARSVEVNEARKESAKLVRVRL